MMQFVLGCAYILFFNHARVFAPCAGARPSVKYSNEVNCNLTYLAGAALPGVIKYATGRPIAALIYLGRASPFRSSSKREKFHSASAASGRESE
jgi:hypothetical protein